MTDASNQDSVMPITATSVFAARMIQSSSFRRRLRVFKWMKFRPFEWKHSKLRGLSLGGGVVCDFRQNIVALRDDRRAIAVNSKRQGVKCTLIAQKYKFATAAAEFIVLIIWENASTFVVCPLVTAVARYNSTATSDTLSTTTTWMFWCVDPLLFSRAYVRPYFAISCVK